ncbi:TetR/AcrR family transcriptional regulator C-terminal domain-containing protein [Streptomyces xylophagus]|uniref:TetR/AcrR family transcriptional regulator C-terminal domain-containing protein n=1 Tax=Streptomyces xylophagus TaxID=285514 RepID=UPI0005BCDA16|nr:TetR/AcrR family transcriptional regulator C-terminal domain-containing protein [Streptomyces xylophagus]
MLDRALAEIAAPVTDQAPFERVKSVLESILRVLLARRGLAQIAAATMPEGESWMRLNETLLDGLIEAGVPPERAYAAAPEEAYPRLTEHHDLIFDGPGPRRLAWFLEVLLNGIAHTRLPAQPASADREARQPSPDMSP